MSPFQIIYLTHSLMDIFECGDTLVTLFFTYFTSSKIYDEHKNVFITLKDWKIKPSKIWIKYSSILVWLTNLNVYCYNSQNQIKNEWLKSAPHLCKAAKRFYLLLLSSLRKVHISLTNYTNYFLFYYFFLDPALSSVNFNPAISTILMNNFLIASILCIL